MTRTRKISPRFSRHIMMEWMLTHPVPVIAVFAAVTIFFAWQIPGLRFQSAIDDLIVENIPEAEYYEAFKKEYGSEEIILIVVKTDGVFNPENFEAIRRIADAVSGIEGVSRVDSLPGIKKAIDIQSKMSLSDFSQIIQPITFFERNFISPDRQTSAVVVVLKDVRVKAPLIRSIQQILDSEKGGRALYQIGMPVVEKALADDTRKDFLRLPPLTFSLMILVLFFLFRNVRWVMLSAGSVAVALIWTFGFMALSQVPLSLLTLIVPIFLIAVGTAYTLHILSDYQTSAADSASPRDAVFRCFSRMSLPTILAVATTTIGIGALMINRISGVRAFALFSCFGMLSLLAVLLGLLPAIMAWLPPPRADLKSRPSKTTWLDGLLGRIIAVNLGHQKKTFGVLIGISLVAVAGIFFIHVETNPVDFFKRSSSVSRHFHDIYQDMAGSFPVNLVLNSKTDSYFETPEHLEQIAQIQAFLTSLDGVDTTLSFADFVKLVNYASNQYRPAAYKIPEESFEVRMLMNTYKSILGQDMFTRFMDIDTSKTNILLRTHMASSREFLEAKQDISEYMKTYFSGKLDFHITGLGMVIAQSSHILTIGQMKSLFLTLSIIFAMMLLLFLSGKVGLIAITANLFPIIMNFGFMGWMGIKFSVATSMVASIAIGLAVDDTIHYLFRYNREFKKDLDKDRALKDTLRHVGKPIVFTSMTIAAGFCILILSHFKPTSVYGLLMVITMATAIIGDLILLPSMMRHVELITAWDLLRLLPSLGGLPGGIVHELNQPLNAIKMGSDFLQIMVSRGEKIPEKDLIQVADEIGNQVDRASEIIQRLSEFGQKPTVEKKWVDVNRPIQNTVAVIGSQLELDNIRLEIDLEDHLPRISAHENRLAQVIFNLVANAAEAIERRSGDEIEADRRIVIRSFQQHGHIVISIADTGVGIPDAVKDRVFEPFFTTKAAGRGKGLGLSISQEIIRDYGGVFEIESRLGSGTIFKVSFRDASYHTGNAP